MDPWYLSAAGKVYSIIYDSASSSPTGIIISSKIGARDYYLLRFRISDGGANWRLYPGTNGGETIEI